MLNQPSISRRSYAGDWGSHSFSFANTWQHISPRFQRDVEQYQGLVRPVCSG